MDITKEANGELNAIIRIKLTEEDYAESVSQQLSDYRKKASMPGFRPGKVPMGMIRKMYGVNVLAEEVNKKVSEGLNNYILENKINVLGYPLPNMEKTNPVDFDTQKEFDFFFDIGLSPEFELSLSDAIKVPYYSIKITDEEVGNAVKDVLVRNGVEENPESAEVTDALQGKFIELDKDGQVVEGGHTHDGYFRLEDIKLKTIQNKLIGIAAGGSIDFNLSKAFKDESKVRSLLHLHEGSEDKLEADYRFEVEKVIRVVEAELGEELYKKLYPAEDLKTEDDFRKRLTEDLKKHFQRDTDRQLLADSINALMDLTNLDLPDAFMKRWLLESNQGKITAEQIEEQYESYGKSIRWQLIEGKLQEQFGEEIIVTEEEIREKVRSYFSQMSGGMEANPQIEGIIDSILQNKEEKQRMYHDMQDEKYIKLFKNQLKLKEKEVDSKKFFEIVSETK